MKKFHSHFHRGKRLSILLNDKQIIVGKYHSTDYKNKLFILDNYKIPFSLISNVIIARGTNG